MNRAKRILLIDDAAEDRELYRRYLEQDPSYIIDEIPLGQQGLEQWQQFQPDAILLDYALPDLDGLEFLAALKASAAQRLPAVVMLTGQAEATIAVAAMKAGAQDYLVKGQITATKLQSAIQDAITAVQLQTQLQQISERERLVWQIIQKIQQSLDLHTILQTAVDEVRHFLQTDRALIFQLDADGRGNVVAESVGANWQALLSMAIFDPCLAAVKLNYPQTQTSLTHDRAFTEEHIARYRKGQVTAIADVQNSGIATCHIELLQQFQVQANLVVPILHDNQCWGLLIAHHCSAPKPWQPFEIELLQQIASPLSIALRQAELYQQTQRELIERQQAEANLRLSEERYTALAQISPVGIFRTDAAGDCQYVNARWCELAGLSPEAAAGKGWAQAIHPDDRNRVFAEWYEATVLNQPFHSEYRFQTPEGAVSWLVGQAIAEKDSSGNTTGYVGTITDITARKQMEQALQVSEERLRVALNASRLGTWDWNIQTQEISWSENLEALFGLAPGEFDGSFEMFIDRLHPDDRDRVLAAIQQAVATGEDYDVEFRVVYPDGRIRWALSQGKVFYDASGQPIRMAGSDLDITERKRDAEALQESEARFRQLTENIDVVFWLKEIPSHRTIYTSSAYQRLWGFDSQELQNEPHTWFNHIYVEDRAKVAAAFEATALIGQYDQEYRIVLPDGSIRWVHDRCFPLHNEAGTIYRLAGIAEDITERRQIESDLRINEQLLRLALTSAQAGSWDWELKTNQLMWSPENFELYGLPQTETLEYAKWRNALHPLDRERVDTEVVSVIEQRLSELKTEFRVIHPQHGVRWLLALGRLTLDESGEPIRLSGINLDITDRKQTEEILRQSEEFKSRLLASSPDCIKVLDIEGRLLYMNPNGLCLMEIDDFSSYLYTEWVCFWQDEYRAEAEQALIAAKAGQSSLFRGFCPTAQGTNKWWEVIVSPILNADGQTEQILSVSRDITERKQVELARERLLQQEQTARIEAERANQIKDEFLAILSHELRSPLNPILGWTKLLQTRKFDEARTAEALATIERNAKLQTQLIDDLLDVAKILRGKLSIEMAPINLVDVIESAIDTVRATATAKSIVLQAALPSVGRVLGDSARLQQIVWNLLSNAIKFTPANGRVHIQLERAGYQAQIIVSDTGKGINPDFLPYLFESFRQEDASITRQYGGLGLGLAIVRSLVEAHNGVITASSLGEGQGATFTVRLPLLDVELEPRQPRKLFAPALDLSGIRILTVDDEFDARELINVLLTQYGATVLTVSSATEALTALTAFQPDVLISDIGMPEVDGYSLMQQIRALPADKGGTVMAIALTAYARGEDQQRALDSGYQKHLTKPLEPEQLVQTVVDLATNRTQLHFLNVH